MVKPYTADDKQIKKSYDSPRLVVYGDVREITRSNTKSRKPDNGLGGIGTN